MAKLQPGRFPISKNGYVVSQLRITTLRCSIGCAQMAKLQLTERCWVWVNEKGAWGPPHPLTAPKTVAHPSGSHIGWRRPPWGCCNVIIKDMGVIGVRESHFPQ